jgi:hypothetical protein
MNPLKVTTEQFLSTLFDPNDTVCLRVFSDRKDEDAAFKGLKMETEAAKIEGLRETLAKHNRQNRGIFFCVNSGGHNDTDITRINAQFVEMDDFAFDEQWARVQAFALPPSLVVQTQKSLHCYWLMKKPEVAKFRKVQKQLVAQFGGDPTCVNESRVLRLPGYYHCKKEPVMVSVVLFAPERRYTQDELSEALPATSEESSAIAAPSVKGSVMRLGASRQTLRLHTALQSKRCKPPRTRLVCDDFQPCRIRGWRGGDSRSVKSLSELQLRRDAEQNSALLGQRHKAHDLQKDCREGIQMPKAGARRLRLQVSCGIGVQASDNAGAVIRPRRAGNQGQPAFEHSDLADVCFGLPLQHRRRDGRDIAQLQRQREVQAQSRRHRAAHQAAPRDIQALLREQGDAPRGAMR